MHSLSEYSAGYRFIPIICGPTASGKSDIALEVCEACGGELVSCDSMQIYKGLDIGTAKATREEQARVPHHMIDIIEPDKSYSVSDYYKQVLKVIDDILKRGKLPVICGGTGQYISALVKGLDYGNDDETDKAVNKLYERYESEGIDGIYSELEEVDPEAASKIHPNNTRRVIRAYAVYLSSGKTFTDKNRESVLRGPEYPFMLFQPDRDRSIIYDRVNLRVDKMISAGLVQEAEWLYRSYSDHSTTAFQAIGYKELFPYITGEISLDKAVYDLKLNTRHYAKRQLTWFRGMSDIVMISPDNYKSAQVILEQIANCP